VDFKVAAALRPPDQEDLRFYSTAAKGAVKPNLLQLRVHRDLRVQDFRHRASLLGGFSIFLESGGIRTRDFANHVNVARCNRPSRIQFLERKRDGG